MKKLLAIALTCLATTAASDGLLDMTDEERATFREEVRDYLLEEPDLLLEVIAILEERDRQAAAAAAIAMVEDNAEALFNDGFSYVGGNPEGSITIVEFLDYQCGFCKQAHSEVNSLIERDGDIRYIVKEFPVLGPGSEAAARAALATLELFGPEVYFEYHDALMTHPGRHSEASVAQIANALGIDVRAMQARMGEPDIAARIDSTLALARTMRINGTPTFVIGDEIVRGYVPQAQMEAVIARERQDS